MMCSNGAISTGFFSTFFQFKVETPAFLIKCPSLPVPPIADALKGCRGESLVWGKGGREGR